MFGKQIVVMMIVGTRIQILPEQISEFTHGGNLLDSLMSKRRVDLRLGQRRPSVNG